MVKLTLVYHPECSEDEKVEIDLVHGIVKSLYPRSTIKLEASPDAAPHWLDIVHKGSAIVSQHIQVGVDVDPLVFKRELYFLVKGSKYRGK